MDGEFFGSTLDFEYNIGDKLYDFAIMEYNEFDKLKILYTELINIVCSNKECNGMDKKVNFLFEMFHKVQECLKFSPYTHFYTQTLIDIIIKTYNSGVFRSDLLFKNNIGVYIDNTEYTPNEIFEEIEENHYVLQTIMYEWTTEIDKISKKKHNEYIKFQLVSIVLLTFALHPLLSFSFYSHHVRFCGIKNTIWYNFRIKK